MPRGEADGMSSLCTLFFSPSLFALFLFAPAHGRGYSRIKNKHRQWLTSLQACKLRCVYGLAERHTHTLGLGQLISRLHGASVPVFGFSFASSRNARFVKLQRRCLAAQKLREREKREQQVGQLCCERGGGSPTNAKRTKVWSRVWVLCASSPL